MKDDQNSNRSDGKHLKLALAAAALGMSIGVNPATTLAANAPDADIADEVEQGGAAAKRAAAQHPQVAYIKRTAPEARYFKWARPPAVSIKMIRPAQKAVNPALQTNIQKK